MSTVGYMECKVCFHSMDCICIDSYLIMALVDLTKLRSSAIKNVLRILCNTTHH